VICAFVSRQAHKGSNHDGPIREFKSHRVGLQISRRFHSKIPPEDAVWGNLKRHLGPVFRQLAEQRESRVEEGHLMPDHVHMLLSIPPKYAVSQVVGYIKGKSAIHLARVYGERKRGFVGQSFWARGYFVSTVGRDETVIREYIKNQESEDQKLEQLNLWR
jgi:putative transposase